MKKKCIYFYFNIRYPQRTFVSLPGTYLIAAASTWRRVAFAGLRSARVPGAIAVRTLTRIASSLRRSPASGSSGTAGPRARSGRATRRNRFRISGIGPSSRRRWLDGRAVAAAVTARRHRRPAAHGHRAPGRPPRCRRVYTLPASNWLPSLLSPPRPDDRLHVAGRAVR